MSTDVEERIAALAVSWERQAAPVTVEEIEAATVIGRASALRESTPARASELEPTDVPVVEIDRRHRRTRWVMAGAVGVAASIVVVLAIVSQREQDPVDPVSPAPTDTAAPPPTVPVTLPDESPDTTAVPTTALEVPATTVAPLPTADELIATQLAEMDAARSVALRAFTTIGFTVRRSQTYPDGTPYENAFAQPESGTYVVMRNDGSVAVSASTGTGFYDATTGTVRGVFAGLDGQPLYQQIDGQVDSSLALGIPTGLSNGIVTPIEYLSQDVVAIEEEVLDGRPTWRIEQHTELRGFPGGDEDFDATTWIDQQTGVTVKTLSVGGSSVNGVPITDEITLSDLRPGEPLPDNFPNPFPPDAPIDVSGDPMQFVPASLDEAISELGAGVVVPTLSADQIVLSQLNFGDGIASPSLILRWFDGFAKAEFRIDRYPSPMAMPDTCHGCGQTLLEEIQSTFAERPGSVAATRDGISVSIRGDSSLVAEVIASLSADPVVDGA